jgi:HD superfamily phosphohydrolase
MQRTIHLALYGSLEHGSEDDMSWDLYQTEALARLRDISLSSIPSRFAPHGMAASRFHHSVGVAHLARKLCSWRRGLAPYRELLIASALCHDIGSPPFSHISELFFHDLTGRTHEQQTAKLLAKGTELHKLLHAYNVNAKDVVAVVNGKHEPLGPLIAGSIDLDNIDNSLHLLVSLGYHDYLPYHPLQLLKAFRFRGGVLALDADYLSEIFGWAEARRTLYALLGAEPNLSSASMLYRALEYAYAEGALSEKFFRLGESDALYHLRYECGHETRLLVNRLLRWKQYPEVYNISPAIEDPRIVSLYSDWRLRRDFSNQVASELGLAAHELCLYAGRSRGEKNITLPFVGENADAATALFRDRVGAQRLTIFAHKRCRELHPVDTNGRLPKVTAVVEHALAQLAPTDGSNHVFF